MKTRSKFAHVAIVLSVFALIVYVFTAPARAAVSSSVCFEMKKETITRTLTSMASSYEIGYDGPDLPWGFYLIVINPGGANEEQLYVKHATSSNYLSTGGLGRGSFVSVHQPGEPILISHDGQAVFGYNNTGSANVVVPRGVNGGGNYFAPGPLVYSAQPTNFLPGAREDVMRLNVVLGHSVSWWLLGTEAEFSGRAENLCGTINYQGRLSDGANAANGQYDMHFQAYDSATGGIAQGAGVSLDNVQVTNGVFTVQLKLGGSLTKNFMAKFLEIGVKPGNAAAGDPYTILTPRQPITSVPYAINAEYATNAGNAATATTATTATTALNANTATNSAQLGGIAASSYLTNTSLLGQSATTVRGSGTINITSATTAYALIPGLAQTIDVPENSVIYISTDGGIYSLGAINTVSVVDVAIFVDGAAVSERRVVINNSGLAGSVANWSLALAQTLSPGSHTVEVKVRNSFTGPASVISGDPVLRPQLTVAVVKK